MYERADDGGMGAHSPDVEGVYALGATREEVEQRVSEALASHFATCAGAVSRCAAAHRCGAHSRLTLSTAGRFRDMLRACPSPP
jgi:hypothetical protein